MIHLSIVDVVGLSVLRRITVRSHVSEVEPIAPPGRFHLVDQDARPSPVQAEPTFAQEDEPLLLHRLRHEATCNQEGLARWTGDVEQELCQARRHGLKFDSEAGGRGTMEDLVGGPPEDAVEVHVRRVRPGRLALNRHGHRVPRSAREEVRAIVRQSVERHGRDYASRRHAVHVQERADEMRRSVLDHPQRDTPTTSATRPQRLEELERQPALPRPEGNDVHDPDGARSHPGCVAGTSSHPGHRGFSIAYLLAMRLDTRARAAVQWSAVVLGGHPHEARLAACWARAARSRALDVG
jgi:hypothetical protein